jgi:hypothetical protein
VTNDKYYNKNAKNEQIHVEMRFIRKNEIIIYVSKLIQYKSKCTKSITITNAMFENSQLQRLKSYANRTKPVSPSASFSNFAPTKRRSSTPPAFNSYITCKTFQLEKVQKRNEK